MLQNEQMNQKTNRHCFSIINSRISRLNEQCDAADEEFHFIFYLLLRRARVLFLLSFKGKPKNWYFWSRNKSFSEIMLDNEKNRPTNGKMNFTFFFYL